MEALKVLGTEKIGKIEFTGIEGGFGEGKKSNASERYCFSSQSTNI